MGWTAEQAMDAHYSKSAEDCLYSELAFAIGKEKSEMRQLIADTIKKMLISGCRNQKQFDGENE